MKIQERDPLYDKAKDLVRSHPEETVGFIQRHLAIGYCRAATLLDVLAEEKFLNFSNGNYKLKYQNKKRDLFITLFLFILLGIIIYFIFFNSVSNLTIKLPSVKHDSTTCTRSEMYDMPPEFKRVLSLILQRKKQRDSYYAPKLEKMINCLNIQYADLKSSGSEGVFYFDKSVSSSNNLVIKVNNSYSFTDDLSTAYLLIHEVTHAKQFMETISGEKEWRCVDSEVEAFYEQLIFGSDINREESKSVIARLETGSNNSQLKLYENLLNMSWDASLACRKDRESAITKEEKDCWQNNLTQQIKAMITESPFYQKQCKL